MAAGMTIKCPMCGEVLPLRVDVLANYADGSILARIDKTAADAHAQTCKGRERQPAANLPVKVDRKVPLYVAPGNRFCTGCGMTAATCLSGLEGKHPACCGMCSEGNSHPTPGGDMSCAEWAKSKGAPNNGA